MTSQRISATEDSQSTRQIAVRFIHAPCVKLTLQPRPVTPPPPGNVRVLRLGRESAAIAR